MNEVKHQIAILLICSVILSCGCTRAAGNEGAEIQDNERSASVEEISRLTIENEQLDSEVSRLEEEVQQLLDDVWLLQNDAEVAQKVPLLYADLLKQNGWELLETETLDAAWTELLCAYNRYIPDFEDINELEDRELVEAATFLLYNLDFDFVEGDRYDLRGMSDIPVEYLDVLLRNVFQRIVDLEPYTEGGQVIPRTVSYHHYYHPRIITLYQRGDTYHAVLDTYVLAEDNEMEKEEFVEKVEAGLVKKNFSSSMILQRIETAEGGFFRVLSSRTT